MWKCLLALLLVFRTEFDLVNCRSTEKQHTNVDILTTDYLVHEQHLWSMIDSNQNRENTLKLIYDVHQAQFEQNFGEVGIVWKYSVGAVSKVSNLVTAVATINSTSGVALTILKNHEYQKLDEFSANAVNLIEKAISVYEQASNAEFWEFVKTVRFIYKSSNLCSFPKAYNGRPMHCFDKIHVSHSSEPKHATNFKSLLSPSINCCTNILRIFRQL